MKNMLRIVRNDAKRITRSAVAMVIIMGLCIVPCLYAWFNIFSNWDPYGESATSRIRVAVVSQDKGADVLGIALNVGDTIIETLESNDQIGWVFAKSQREALGRVYSGDCYAALVVPPTFSKDLVSFMTLKFKHPQLYYYDNGKKNAIAPKITGQAKNSVQNQVNAAFLSTLVASAAKVVGVLESNGVDVQETLRNLSDKIEDLSGKLDQAVTIIDSLVNLAGASRNLMYASGTLVADMSLAVGYTGDLASTVQSNMIANGATLRQNINAITEALMGTQDNLGSFYDDLSQLLEPGAPLDLLTQEDLESRRQVALNMQESMAQMAQDARDRGLNGLALQMELASRGMGAIADHLGALVTAEPGEESGWDQRREEIQEILGDLNGAQGAISSAVAEAADTLGLEVEDALLDYLEERKLITPMPGHENAFFLSLQDKRINVRSVENMVKKYARIVTPLKRITPHKLRSTYGTSLYRETGDIYLVADVLGHSDVNTTKKHYAALEDERRRSARDKVRLRDK